MTTYRGKSKKHQRRRKKRRRRDETEIALAKIEACGAKGASAVQIASAILAGDPRARYVDLDGRHKMGLRVGAYLVQSGLVTVDPRNNFVRMKVQKTQRATHPQRPPKRIELSAGQATDGSWQVCDGSGAIVASGLSTNAEAWKWIDRNDQKHLNEIDRSNRIRLSFAGDDTYGL